MRCSTAGLITAGIVAVTTSATTALAQAPTVTTNPATTVLATAASVSAQADAHNDSTFGWLRFSTTNPGTCNDTFGTRLPTGGEPDLGNGYTWVDCPNGGWCGFISNPGDCSCSGCCECFVTNNDCLDACGADCYDGGYTAGPDPVLWSETLTGLDPDTTYYYCGLARNSSGTSVGTVRSFTTMATAVPVVTSQIAMVAATVVQFGGSANPNGLDTTAWFRYATTDPGTCNDSFGTRVPATGGNALGSSLTSQGYSQVATGLVAQTAYYYCTLAQNSAGTVVGTVATFTTPAAGTATTAAATNLLTATATLNGQMNANGTATWAWFRYDTSDPGTCNDTFGTASYTSGYAADSTTHNYAVTVRSLLPATTYYYCAVASNMGVGAYFGGVMSFTTLPAVAPTMTTLAATDVRTTRATLNGEVSPNGGATRAMFRYSTTDPGTCDDTFGAATGYSLWEDSAVHGYSMVMLALAPATTYYFCAVGSSPSGVGLGGVLSFTTATTSPPTVTTLPPAAYGFNWVGFMGKANPNGDPTTIWLRYSTTDPGACNDAFGTKIPSGGYNIGQGTTEIATAQYVSSLQPATTYYYCAVAENVGGKGFGSLATVTTPPAPIPAIVGDPTTAILGTSATLHAHADAFAQDTFAWFRYDTASPGACNDSFGTRLPATGELALGNGYWWSDDPNCDCDCYQCDGYDPVAWSADATGLSPGVTYYFCGIAKNAWVTGFGDVQTFTTLAFPTVTTLTATAVGATAATLNGSANPNGDATTAWFRYAASDPGACNDSFGTRIPGSLGTALGSGTSAQSFSQSLTGLSRATTYYFCAIAQNGLGLSVGSVQSFTAGGATGDGCAAAGECQTGNCVDGVCCDDPCNGTDLTDCRACSVAAGATVDGACEVLQASHECRAATAACDVADHCSGTTATCPADEIASAGTPCRSAIDACDAAEVCDGTSTACPADAVADSTVVCRAPLSACDPLEHCDGATLPCPADVTTTPGLAVEENAVATGAVGVAYAYNDSGRVSVTGAVTPPRFSPCPSTVSAVPTFKVDEQTGLVDWVPTVAGATDLCVRAQDDCGSDTYEFTVVVSAAAVSPPVAHMEIAPQLARPNQAVSFNGSGSTADPRTLIVSYDWTFGDGAAAAGVATTYAYPLAGSYIARLLVRDGFGAADTAEAPLFVGDAQCPTPPLVRIEADRLTGSESLEVHFDCLVDGVVSYSWDFGDGGTSAERAPVRTFGPGRFRVRLAGADAAGCTGYDAVQVVVEAGGPQPPVCRASVAPSGGPAPLTVTFSAVFVDPNPDGAVVAADWVFDDGFTTSEAQFVRTFPEAGSAHATLRVEASSGLTCLDTVEVTVQSPAGETPPKILSIANVAASCDGPYDYSSASANRVVVRGTPPITWSLGKTVGTTLLGAPAGMTVDPTTGLVRWQPGPPAKTEHVVIVARNSAGVAEQSFDVEVACATAVTGNGDQGCGCHTGGAASGVLLSVAWLVAAWRRRRR